MNRLFPALALCALALPALASPAAGPKTDDEKTLYAMGLIMGGQLKGLGLSKVEFEMVKKGMEDTIAGTKPAVELNEWGPKVQAFASKKQQAQGEKDSAKEKEASKGFLEKVKKEAGVQVMPSGLVFKTLKPGQGASPKATDKVKVHYEGTLINGTVFDSSKKRGQPAEFPLNGVIPCWTEGVAKMKVGETARLVCPSSIAYGDRGHPPTIPGGATLVFEVELLEILK